MQPIARVGSKFIVEVEEIYVSSADDDLTPKRLYRMKGFNSLVFDDEGIEHLESIEEYKLKLLTEILGHFTKPTE